jgi:hypothetical protein
MNTNSRDVLLANSSPLPQSPQVITTTIASLEELWSATKTPFPDLAEQPRLERADLSSFCGGEERTTRLVWPLHPPNPPQHTPTLGPRELLFVCLYTTTDHADPCLRCLVWEGAYCFCKLTSALGSWRESTDGTPGVGWPWMTLCSTFPGTLNLLYHPVTLSAALSCVFS